MENEYHSLMMLKPKDKSLQCVLPAMAYGAEKWTLTALLVHEFRVLWQAP